MPLPGEGAVSFALWRQDDNGNRFLVGCWPDRAAAEARMAELTRAPHKQTYWISGVPGTIPEKPEKR